MKIEDTALPDVKLITYQVFGDERGSFMETYDSAVFRELGIDTAFVQDSSSWSALPNTVRGLHFQVPPRAQDKLVRVTCGRVFDVVVDIRRASPTFGHHMSMELNAETPTALFVPAGFAHGFCSLSEDAEIAYKMSDHFTPEFYKGILWSDPALGIDWPRLGGEIICSDKDRDHPTLAELPEYF